MEITAVPNERKTAGVRILMSSACAGIFVFGIVMAILGAILPSLFSRIQFDKSQAGNLFFYMNLAMLAMSVFLARSSTGSATKYFLPSARCLWRCRLSARRWWRWFGRYSTRKRLR
jgi:ABC-type Fe3+ transport system permease subunit